MKSGTGEGEKEETRGEEAAERAVRRAESERRQQQLGREARAERRLA